MTPATPMKSMKDAIDAYDRRWSQLDAEYSYAVRALYTDISSVLLPRNGRFIVTGKRNAKPYNSIPDNTGTLALRIAGAGIMAGAMSPARPWFRLRVASPDLNREPAVRRYLNEVTEIILDLFAQSNVYRALHVVDEELVAFGTGAVMVLEDDEKVLRLHPLTVGEYRIAANFRGEIDTCYRTFDLSVGEIVGEFGLSECPQHVRELYHDRVFDKRVTVRHVIEPRPDRDITKADNVNMAWKSVYYVVGHNESVLRESGFDYFPVLVPRWKVIGSDVYGSDCPGMLTLGDVKQLHHEQLRKAQGIDFETLPPMFAPPEMKGQEFRWLPGGITHVNSTAQASGLRPAFEVRRNLEHLIADIQDVRNRIREGYFADLFLMLASRGEDPSKTATEVVELHEEKLIQLGPVVENINDNMLAPLVRNGILLASRAGLLPPEPPELAGQGITLQFTSVLAQAQRAVGVTPIERVLLIAGNVAQAKPDMLDNLDEDALWSELTDMLGVSPRISRDASARAKLRKARIDAQAKAAEASAQEQSARTAKDAAGAMSQVATTGGANNALSDVLSLFSGYNQPSASAY